MSRVRHGGAGSQSCRDKTGFSQLLLTRSSLVGRISMDLDTIGALSGQGDGDRHEFLVLFGNGAGDPCGIIAQM